MNKIIKIKRFFNLKILSLALAWIVFSCNDTSESINPEDSANVSTESSEDSFHNDAEDIANSAAAQTDATLGGRTEAWVDNRICGDTKITLLKLDNTNTDTLTIDFGATGCTDAKGNTRKGKIIVIFSPGFRWALQATHSISFLDFFVNGVKVEGTRTVKNVSPTLDGDITFDITLTGGKLTFPDGTSATREAHHFRQWFRNGTPLNLADDQHKILASFNGTTSTASGINRKGFNYMAQVINDIVYKNTCLIDKIFIPASGLKVLTVTKGTNPAVQISVDFGDGTCDKLVTVTVNGKSQTITVSRDING